MQTEQKGINQETINRMELYRRILLQNGFSEPICQKERSLHWMFYKETTGNSAFVLNLTGYSGGCLWIRFYGFYFRKGR